MKPRQTIPTDTVSREKCDPLELTRAQRNILLRFVAIGALVSTLLALPSNGAPQAGAKAGSRSPSEVPSEETLRIRLQVNPHDSAAHKQLIEILQRKDLFRPLVMEDATWIRNNPNDYWALDELVAYAKVALNDPELAIEQERAFLARASRDADDFQYDATKARLASDLNERGRPLEAIGILDELVRLNPEDAGLWADRSGPLISLGRLTEAIQSLQRALEIDPSSESIHEALADAFAKSRDFIGAETEYRSALSVYQAKYKKGETSTPLDDLIKRLVKTEAEYHNEHSLAGMHLKLAHVLMLEHKWQAALTETQAAIDADNTDFVALYLRAEIYDAEGDHEHAKETRDAASSTIQRHARSEFSKAPKAERLEVDPRVVFLMDSLWNKDAGYPALPSEIVSILEPRIAVLSPYARFILATAYIALNRVPDAKKQWEDAIASDTKLDNAVSNANLGRELMKAGDFSGAVTHLRRAYELDPQNKTCRMDYQLAQKRASSSVAARP